MKSKKKKKPPKRCSCGRIIKQKYFQTCTYCRQQRKRDEKEQRELTRILNQALKG